MGKALSLNPSQGKGSSAEIDTVMGSWHNVSKKHLRRYTGEMDASWNTRKLTDGERTFETLRKSVGKRLTYKPLTAASEEVVSEEPTAHKAPKKPKKKYTLRGHLCPPLPKPQLDDPRPFPYF